MKRSSIGTKIITMLLSAILAAAVCYPAGTVSAQEEDPQVCLMEEEPQGCLTEGAVSDCLMEEESLTWLKDPEPECAEPDDLLAAGTVSLEEVENPLSGLNRSAYDALFEKVSAIAAGEESYTVFDLSPDVSTWEGTEWTAEDLGVSSLVDETSDGVQVSKETRDAMKKLLGFDGDLVVLTLATRCMTQLYWFGLGYYCGYPYEVYYDGAAYKVRMTGQIHVILSVSPDYAAVDSESGERIPYTVDVSKLERVNAAIKNAEQIVKEAESIEGDREKMWYYYETINDLSEYDHVAAAGAPYGDPWQIINVFDGDPDTKVVCEGYSKAFQFLCDQTAFEDSETSVYCVTGQQTWEGAGSLPASMHMWNVVHMADGNYLVDITNGNKQPYLFLASCIKGTLTAGYYIPVVTLAGKELNYHYIYSDDARSLYADDELRLAGNEGIWYAVQREIAADETEAELLVYRTETGSGTESLLLPEETLSEGESLRAEAVNKGTHLLSLQIYQKNGRLLSETMVLPGQTISLDPVTPSADLRIVLEQTTGRISEVVLSRNSVTFNKKAQTLKNSIVVTSLINGEPVVLTEGRDYTVTYRNNKNAGQAEAVITGCGNYTGTVTKTFTIKPKKIDTAALKHTKLTYNGSFRKPPVTVSAGKDLLKNGRDYKIVYKKNKNVGTATAVIKGIGNYSGTVKKTFRIIPKGTSVTRVTFKSNKLTVKWKKQDKQIDGYQILLSTSADFSKNRKAVKVGKGKYQKTIVGLKTGKTYYVKARTYKKVGKTVYYSAWSSIKTHN